MKKEVGYLYVFSIKSGIDNKGLTSIHKIEIR